MDIAVFSRPAGGKESDVKILFRDKRRLRGAESSVTVTVKDKPYDVGVDPYNKMIDRVSTGNRMGLHFRRICKAPACYLSGFIVFAA